MSGLWANSPAHGARARTDPCGSIMTRPDWRSHLVSPDVTKVSIVTWAPLKKSPNCASQMTSSCGFSQLMPYSKPSTASSLSELLAISILPCGRVVGVQQLLAPYYRGWGWAWFGVLTLADGMLFKGTAMVSVAWSTSMTWRCENVPRPTSWPEMLAELYENSEASISMSVQSGGPIGACCRHTECRGPRPSASRTPAPLPWPSRGPCPPQSP